MKDKIEPKDKTEPWHGGVPPGAPGAGWFIATIFVLSIVVLTGWQQGWRQDSRNTAAAPEAAHHTTASGNKVPQ
jgi:hypothetical protein